jgi:hypothetical protein
LNIDPIKYVKHAILDGWHYGVAIKVSGIVDFYFNFIKVSSTESEKDEVDQQYKEVAITFEGIYLKHQNYEQSKMIKLEEKTRISLNMAKKI